MQKNDGSVTRFRVIDTEAYFQMVKLSLAETGSAQVRVTGNSMWPMLHHLRDSVTIIPHGKIRRGDVVLFDRQNGRYALHRVIRTGEQGFTMAGDNQWHVERDLPYAQIVGVVDSMVRNGRSISCSKKSVRFYAWLVTLFTLPRIYLRRAVGKVLKPFRRGRSRV